MRFFPVARTNRRLKREHPELRRAVRRSTAHVIARFPRLQITSTTGGSHAAGSLHYAGQAVDLAVPYSQSGAQEYMDRAGAWIQNNRRFRRRFYEAIHRSANRRHASLSIKNGWPEPASYWGVVTWNTHGNHIHLAQRF